MRLKNTKFEILITLLITPATAHPLPNYFSFSKNKDVKYAEKMYA